MFLQIQTMTSSSSSLNYLHSLKIKSISSTKCELQTGKNGYSYGATKPALRLAPSTNGFSYPNPIASLDAEAEIWRDRSVLPRLGQRRFKYDDHGRPHVESCYLEMVARASELAFEMQRISKQLKYQSNLQYQARHQ
jgi:hypothetical protein